MSKLQQEGGTPLERGGRAVRLSRLGGKRRRHRPADRRAMGSVAVRRRRSRAEIDKSDIYTLRRIVPADRGQSWDKK